jgi:hypothetical protein
MLEMSQKLFFFNLKEFETTCKFEEEESEEDRWCWRLKYRNASDGLETDGVGRCSYLLCSFNFLVSKVNKWSWKKCWSVVVVLMLQLRFCQS